MVLSPEVLEPRHEDYSLGEEQLALADVMARFLVDACPSDRVRRAESSGFDAELWSQLIAQGVLEISVPEDLGGNPLVDLALVSEELGYVLAPAPFPEVAAAIAVLAPLQDPAAREALTDVLEGRELVTLDLEGSALKGEVTPTGGASRRYLSLDGTALVLVETEAVGDFMPNVAGLPYARALPVVRTSVLATGAAAEAAIGQLRRRWQVLTAARLVGLARAARDMSVDFAKNRFTRGVSIGTLQGVSFPLADAHIGYVTARNLVHRAAWYADREPDSHPELAPAALIHASQVALQASEAGVQTHGGMGVSSEADITLAFCRAQGWGLSQENLRKPLDELGRLIAFA